MSRIHDALKRAEQQGETVSSTLQVEMTGSEKSSVPDVLKEQPLPEIHTGKMVTQLPEGVLLESPIMETVASVNVPMVDDSAASEFLLSQATQTNWALDPKSMLAFGEESDVMGAEAFRTARSHLKLVRQRRNLKKILVASPLPKEGKTFVAANLAQAMVWEQRGRVLLIDGDLRLPSLHDSLGAPRSPGLAEYLRGEVNDFSFIQRGPLENLFFVPSGRSDGKSTELLGNGRFKSMLDQLVPVFDWIVIDSSPAVLVSDAKLIAELCDGVLMVVRIGQTPAEEARRVSQELRGNRFLGVVVNCSKRKLKYGSYYYNKRSERKRGLKERPLGIKVA